MEEKILALLQQTADEHGYNIVDVKIVGSSYMVLQILLEKSNLEPITIADCATFSRKSSILLDVGDLFKNKYTLEVGSAGINRPLVKKEDFDRFKDNDVVIKTKIPLDNRKTFRGHLLGIEGNIVKIIVEESKEVNIDFSMISRANLEIIKHENLNEVRGKNAKNK